MFPSGKELYPRVGHCNEFLKISLHKAIGTYRTKLSKLLVAREFKIGGLLSSFYGKCFQHLRTVYFLF